MMNASAEYSPPRPTRLFRLALVLFPLGLIVTSIISFGIWWAKREAVEARSYKYASALRRDLTEAGIERFATVCQDVFKQTPADAFASVAAYLESSMGAENMGYNLRRQRFYWGTHEVSNIDAELTGKQRPLELLLVLVPYGDASRIQAESQALAGMMALAHSLAGENRALTIRFAALPTGIKDNDGRTPLERFVATCRSDDERFLQLIILGGVPDSALQEIRQAFQADATGVVIKSLPATTHSKDTLTATQVLRESLLNDASR